MDDTIAVSLQELRTRCSAALAKAGLPVDHIEMTLDVLITADLQGIGTHGARRLIPYILRIRSGLINPAPAIQVSECAPAIRLVDGDHGLGPVVGMTGLRTALAVAKTTGIAFVGCRNSHHFGAGAPYALEACRNTMICIGGTNAFPSLAPWGGKDVLLGNNPLFIGVPRQEGPHFILDIAMSVAARGKMRKAAGRGERIPDGWALDAAGNPTNDPVEGLKGYVLPIGGHKGYGLALAIDLIAGALTGSGVGREVQSLFQQWEKPQRVGHFFICLDPAHLMPMEQFQERVEFLFHMIKTSSPLDPEQPILLPGEIEAQQVARHTNEGISFERKIWNSLLALSEGKYDIDVSNV